MKPITLSNILKSIITESGGDFVQKVKFKGRTYSLHKHDDSGKISLYLAASNGEPYLDISTNLPQNPLMDAVWVKMGGPEQVVADSLTDVLEPTKRTTGSGFNRYVMYNVIG